VASINPRREFYLVALVVFEIRRVAVSTAGEGVLIGMHELPAMLFGAIDQPIQGSACSGVEGQVVEAGSPTIMGTVDQRWRLLKHDVGRSQSCTATAQTPTTSTSADRRRHTAARSPDFDTRRQAPSIRVSHITSSHKTIASYRQNPGRRAGVLRGSGGFVPLAPG